MNLTQVDANLSRKGFSADAFPVTPPYVILDIYKESFSDSDFLETLLSHFGKEMTDFDESSRIMGKFSKDLQAFISQSTLKQEDALSCTRLLDAIFAFESWICISNHGREWGWSDVFSGLEETLHVVREKTDGFLSPKKLIDLSEQINSPTVTSAISKKADPDWVDALYLNGYSTMFANSPMLSKKVVSTGIGNGDTNLIFHPNADPIESVSLLINTLEDDPDSIFIQLQGWESMVENGWNFVSPWVTYDHSKKILQEMDNWLEDNDYEERSSDYL